MALCRVPFECQCNSSTSHWAMKTITLLKVFLFQKEFGLKDVQDGK